MMRPDVMPAANLDFAWDRPETADSLRHRLAQQTGQEWLRTAAWVMREARIEEVWDYLSLEEVAGRFPELRPHLGRRLPVWESLLNAAHELGRI
jgi:hypothetical protein